MSGFFFAECFSCLIEAGSLGSTRFYTSAHSFAYLRHFTPFLDLILFFLVTVVLRLVLEQVGFLCGIKQLFVLFFVVKPLFIL